MLTAQQKINPHFSRGDVMEKHRYGNAGINFGPDGRILGGAPLDGTYPGRGRDKSRRRPYDDFRDYRSDDGLDRNYRSMEKPPPVARPHVYPGAPYGMPPRGAPTYKPYALGSQRPPVYPDNSLRKGWNDPMYGGYDKSGLIPPRRRNRDRARPSKIPWEFLFIVIGLVMLILGIANIVVCRYPHGYSRIWTGLLIIEFGIFGIIHKGDYYKKWKNWDYIIAGTLSVIASFVSTGLVLYRLAPTLKEIGITNATVYARKPAVMEAQGPVKLGNDTVWVCMGIDGATVGFLFLSYLVLPMVLYTASKFYDANWEVTAKCKPFCRPALFNPWIQPLFAEAAIFMGIVLYTAGESSYKDTFSPVWAGLWVAIAGVVSGISRKRPDHDQLTVASMIVQFLAMACCVAAIALCTLGMVGNIQDLNKTNPGVDKKWLVGSASLFAIADFFLLVCVTYSLADMGRAFLHRSDMKRGRDDRYSDTSFGSSSSRSSYYNQRRPSPNRADMYRGGPPPDMYRGGPPPDMYRSGPKPLYMKY